MALGTGVLATGVSALGLAAALGKTCKEVKELTRKGDVLQAANDRNYVRAKVVIDQFSQNVNSLSKALSHYFADGIEANATYLTPLPISFLKAIKKQDAQYRPLFILATARYGLDEQYIPRIAKTREMCKDNCGCHAGASYEGQLSSTWGHLEKEVLNQFNTRWGLLIGVITEVIESDAGLNESNIAKLKEAWQFYDGKDIMLLSVGERFSIRTRYTCPFYSNVYHEDPPPRDCRPWAWSVWRGNLREDESIGFLDRTKPV